MTKTYKLKDIFINLENNKIQANYIVSVSDDVRFSTLENVEIDYAGVADIISAVETAINAKENIG